MSSVLPKKRSYRHPGRLPQDLSPFQDDPEQYATETPPINMTAGGIICVVILPEPFAPKCCPSSPSSHLWPSLLLPLSPTPSLRTVPTITTSPSAATVSRYFTLPGVLATRMTCVSSANAPHSSLTLVQYHRAAWYSNWQNSQNLEYPERAYVEGSATYSESDGTIYLGWFLTGYGPAAHATIWNSNPGWYNVGGRECCTPTVRSRDFNSTSIFRGNL